MSEKQKKKNKIIGISIGILVVLLVVISSTYAYWQITKSQEGSNDIIAACLDIDMESVDGTFGLDPAWPLSDSDGMKLNGYTFKVTNNCSEDVNYIIGMDSLAVSDTEYLSYDSIKVSLDNSASTIYGEEDVIDHIEENDPYTIRTSKKIATSVVRGNTSNEHNVKVWIKSDAPVSEQSKVFRGRMFITGGQNIELDEQVRLLATGDISRREECVEVYKGYECTPVTGNDVNYYFYSDGTLKISGTGATKQYLEENEILLIDIIKQYMLNENIELTEGEQGIFDDPMKLYYFAILLNSNDYLVKALSDGAISSVEEFEAAIGAGLGEETLALMKTLKNKLSEFPKMTDLIIEEGITSIGNNTFRYMVYKNLYMGDSVTEIKDGAFSTGGFTDSYKLSSNLTTAEAGAFKELIYTGTFVVPSTLTELNNILSRAYVSEIIIPKYENITAIPYAFFESMPNLTSVVLADNITGIDTSGMFIRENVTLKIYGPEREITGLIIENNDNYKPFKEIIWNYTGE